MSNILENNPTREAEALQSTSFFDIPTEQEIKELAGNSKGFGLSHDPDNRIYATLTHPTGTVDICEIPYLDKDLVQILIVKNPGQMLIYRETSTGPAVVLVPETAQDNLQGKITCVQKFGTDPTGNSHQFSQVVFNGAYGGVNRHNFNEHPAYKATGVIYDAQGHISPYLQSRLIVQPHQDVLYLDFSGGDQMRIQTETLNPESGDAYHFLAEQPLPE